MIKQIIHTGKNSFIFTRKLQDDLHINECNFSSSNAIDQLQLLEINITKIIRTK